MKYSEEERLAIGKKIYEGELTKNEAADKYDIDPYTARDYLRLYRDRNGLPPSKGKRKKHSPIIKVAAESRPTSLEEYEAMSKDELIREIIASKINEARAKKGYEVKGVGAQKKFIPLDNKNTK